MATVVVPTCCNGGRSVSGGVALGERVGRPLIRARTPTVVAASGAGGVLIAGRPDDDVTVPTVTICDRVIGGGGRVPNGSTDAG